MVIHNEGDVVAVLKCHGGDHSKSSNFPECVAKSSRL